MGNLLSDIRSAIDKFDMALARDLLKKVLEQDPSAEAYYLASLAALDRQQKILFLEKTIELDPLHQEANHELQKMQGVSLPEDPKKSAEALESKPGKMNILSIVSFILGLAGLIMGLKSNFPDLGILLWLAALVIGIIALKQLKKKNERGKGWVIAVFLMPLAPVLLIIMFILS